MTEKNSAMQDTVQFTPVNWYPETLRELILNMLDAKKTRDIYGMCDAFDDLYLLSYPFIEKYMDENEFKILDNSEDVEKYLDRVSEPLTDFAAKNNSIHINKAISVIRQKKKVLYKLMAKAKLMMPTQNRQDRPAALAGDDL